MLLRSHGGGNCSGDGGAHEGGPDLHPTEFSGLTLYIASGSYMSTLANSEKQDEMPQNIRIYHECEGRIEKSIPRIAVWHYEACGPYQYKETCSHFLFSGCGDVVQHVFSFVFAKF